MWNGNRAKRGQNLTFNFFSAFCPTVVLSERQRTWTRKRKKQFPRSELALVVTQ